MIRIEIPIKMPTLNDFVEASKVVRGRWNKANAMKSEYQQKIYYYLCKLPVLKPPIRIHFIWVEKNKRRDLDNVSAVGRKFILDTLQICGKLKNDNPNYCVDYWDTFRVGSEYKVIMEIEENVKEWGTCWTSTIINSTGTME